MYDRYFLSLFTPTEKSTIFIIVEKGIDGHHSRPDSHNFQNSCFTYKKKINKKMIKIFIFDDIDCE